MNIKHDLLSKTKNVSLSFFKSPRGIIHSRTGRYARSWDPTPSCYTPVCNPCTGGACIIGTPWRPGQCDLTSQCAFIAVRGGVVAIRPRCFVAGPHN